jgi:hypothetical protein
MLSLIQRLLSTPTDHAEGSAAARPLCPRVLVITQDLRFYAAVLSAVSSTVWEVCLARSLAAALALCRTGTIPIVLYDQCVAQADWHEAFDRLRPRPESPAGSSRHGGCRREDLAQRAELSWL